MTARASILPGHGQISGAGTAIAAVTLFQIATMLSKPLMDQIGAPAVTWLRMVAAAVFLLIWLRPSLVSLPRRSVWAALCLGATLGALSLAAFSAVQRLPIGMVATIGFLGPLGLAVLGAGGARLLTLGLAALAGLGVVLMLVPIGGGSDGAGWTADPVGIALSLLYAGFWALYLVLTRHVGNCSAVGMGCACPLWRRRFFWPRSARQTWRSRRRRSAWRLCWARCCWGFWRRA